jgi:hypothetical protein
MKAKCVSEFLIGKLCEIRAVTVRIHFPILQNMKKNLLISFDGWD